MTKLNTYARETLFSFFIIYHLSCSVTSYEVSWLTTARCCYYAYKDRQHCGTRFKTTIILTFPSMRGRMWNNSLRYIFGYIILIITHLLPYTTSECVFDIREESWYKLGFARLKYWDTISRLEHLTWASFEAENILCYNKELN